MVRPSHCCAFLKRLRVEPILFLFYIATTSYNSGSSVLSTQKLCFPEGPPGIDKICEDTEALKEAADLNQVKGILRACLPATVVIFYGSWRDVTHRILPIVVIAHIGELIATGFQLASSIFWNITPWYFVWPSVLFSSFTGSTGTVTMCAMSYITETSTPEDKALRIPIMMVATLGALCISITSSMMILTALNYLGFYILILAIYGLCLLISVLIIKDKPTKASGGYFESVKNLLIVFRPRPNTFQIWMFIVASALITSMLSVEGVVSNLFLQKKFKITPAQGGYLGGYKMLLSLVTGAVATPLLKRWLKLSDFVISGICVVPSAISCFGMAFAADLTQIYFFASLDLLRITFIATVMNLFTGCLKKSEVGIFSSFLSFAEGMLPIALSPLYTYIFKQTVDTLPGAFYIISGCSIILSGLLVFSASFTYKPYNEAEEETRNQEENHAPEEDIGGVENPPRNTELT